MLSDANENLLPAEVASGEYFHSKRGVTGSLPAQTSTVRRAPRDFAGVAHQQTGNAMMSEDESNPQRGWLNAIVYANSYKSWDQSLNATGLQTQELRYRTLSHANYRSVAESFLLNTRLRRSDWESESSIASYFSDETLLMLSMRGSHSIGNRDSKDVVPLPSPVKLAMEFDETLVRRRSRRHYTGDALPLNYLSAILRAAGGNIASSEADLASGGHATVHFRAPPSAGALYPIDIYFAAVNVERLLPHLYGYDPFGPRLIRLGEESGVRSALDSFLGSDDAISLSRANGIFFLVAQPWRVMRKYGARGMRFVFMEAGAIAQTINLATVALGFGSVECASVVDDEINEALRLDGTFRAVVHTVVVGYPG
jgi:SagB-type dehydrogenase family enzyme